MAQKPVPLVSTLFKGQLYFKMVFFFPCHLLCEPGQVPGGETYKSAGFPYVWILPVVFNSQTCPHLASGIH